MAIENPRLEIARKLTAHLFDIVDRWERDVRAKIYNSAHESSPTLVDHLPDIINSLIEEFKAISDAQSLTENKIAAIAHGKQRAFKTQFSLG